MTDGAAPTTVSAGRVRDAFRRGVIDVDRVPGRRPPGISGVLRLPALRPITQDVNALLDTWTADAARRGELPSMSRWLGTSVDRSSAPVLATGPRHPRLDDLDERLSARAQLAAALLSGATDQRPGNRVGDGRPTAGDG